MAWIDKLRHWNLSDLRLLADRQKSEIEIAKRDLRIIEQVIGEKVKESNQP